MRQILPMNEDSTRANFKVEQWNIHQHMGHSTNSSYMFGKRLKLLDHNQSPDKLNPERRIMCLGS